MDEFLFRFSQKLDNLQMQFSFAASSSKSFYYQCSEQSKLALTQVWNSSKVNQIKDNMKSAWDFIIHLLDELKDKFIFGLSMRKIMRDFSQVFQVKWTKRDFYILFMGFFCGFLIGCYVYSKYISNNTNKLTNNESFEINAPIYMQAIQLSQYCGFVEVVEDAVAPYKCKNNEVLINVKAASVQLIDAKISQGYGKTFRYILQRLFNSSPDLPVILGRDCSGIITDLGPNVERLDVGDEIWLTLPYWSQGTFRQSILVSDIRVSKKPQNTGFESICSLAYAGTIALNVLKQAQINQDNVNNKEILIQNGCTPVGCVLVQILKYWGATITATCFKKAKPIVEALGIPSENIILLNDGKNKLIKELHLREKFNIVFITKECDLTYEEAEQFLKINGTIISTLPPNLQSDSCNFLSFYLLDFYIHLKYYLKRIFGIKYEQDYDESHMCYVVLDELTEFVKNGVVQSVVDSVYHPHNIEKALEHIQSNESIGSTVITFR